MMAIVYRGYSSVKKSTCTENGEEKEERRLDVKHGWLVYR
jgi:hypothetical protein